jgi:hypothetical protein
MIVIFAGFDTLYKRILINFFWGFFMKKFIAFLSVLILVKNLHGAQSSRPTLPPNSDSKSLRTQVIPDMTRELQLTLELNRLLQRFTPEQKKQAGKVTLESLLRNDNITKYQKRRTELLYLQNQKNMTQVSNVALRDIFVKQEALVAQIHRCHTLSSSNNLSESDEIVNTIKKLEAYRAAYWLGILFESQLSKQ